MRLFRVSSASHFALLHFVSVGAEPKSTGLCAPSRHSRSVVGAFACLYNRLGTSSHDLHACSLCLRAKKRIITDYPPNNPVLGKSSLPDLFAVQCTRKVRADTLLLLTQLLKYNTLCRRCQEVFLFFHITS